MRNRASVIRNCENCGKEFNARIDLIKDGNGRFCSRKCGRANKFNEKCNGWRGGRQKDNRGCIRLYSPYHPYARKDYVLESHLVMEKHLGRFIQPAEIVHHINKNPSDNRIENLMLVSKSQHMKLHLDYIKSKIKKKYIVR